MSWLIINLVWQGAKLMKNYIKIISGMKTYLMLLVTQSFSGFGSAMTSYALVIWSYTQKGEALTTALLMASSYAPYVIFSIFAGALSDRWNKKVTMLVCDTVAALSTVVMLFLLQNNILEIWHLYLINAVNGLMNTIQQPASEIAVTQLLPKKYYQKAGGIKYFLNSLSSIMTPVTATAILGMAGMGAIIAFDLFTFSVAFLTLAFKIKIPEYKNNAIENEKLSVSAKKGINYLKKERGIFNLVLFLASINLVASVYDAALPAMVLSRNGGSQKALGAINTVIGITTLLGSIFASVIKEPESRVKVICNCLLFSMGTENFLLAFGRTPFVWCIGGILGFIFIPLMNTNLDAVLRIHIPVHMQGRVYSVRNSLQFFTIPVGYLLGGFLVDSVFEPFMAMQGKNSVLVKIFGYGKGSGAALLFFIIAISGICVCIYFMHNKYIIQLKEKGY